MKRFSGRFWTIIVAGMIMAMVSQVAVAQRDQGGGRGGRGRGGSGGPGGPGGMSAGRLLMAEEVQKALKLTDEQKDKLKAVSEDMAKSLGERRGSDSSAGDR